MKISTLREAAEALGRVHLGNRTDAPHLSQTGGFAAEVERAMALPEAGQVAALSDLVGAARQENIALFSPDLGERDWDAATAAEVKRAQDALRALLAEIDPKLISSRKD